MRSPTLDEFRRHALSRSLFKPTTLRRAIARLGFVQADPIRAPARAQDLTLRHRVKDYRAGDLERHYPRLPIEEDYLVNYGFMPRELHHLMHPRTPRAVWNKTRCAQAQAVLEFVRGQGVVHPREVDAAFDHGKTRNWFGGSSNASTQLLDGMHYRGLLRIARREGGVRLYAAREALPAPADRDAAHDVLVDVLVNKYAPLPEASLGYLLSLLCGGVPHWRAQRGAALQRAKMRLPSAEVEGLKWYWPGGENPASRRHGFDEELRLLAPFDPIVWDRRRFEAFWGWAYRFEAYTPPAKRVRGYYALPLLWRGQAIGWGNAAVTSGGLQLDLGFVSGRAPRDAAFKKALEAERQRLSDFLAL